MHTENHLTFALLDPLFNACAIPAASSIKAFPLLHTLYEKKHLDSYVPIYPSPFVKLDPDSSQSPPMYVLNARLHWLVTIITNEQTNPPMGVLLQSFWSEVKI